MIVIMTFVQMDMVWYSTVIYWPEIKTWATEHGFFDGVEWIEG